MPATRTNRILLTAAAAIGITAGAAGIAGAATSSGGSEPTLPKADAEAAALAEVPGTVTEVEHEGDDGADVWSVEVTDAEGRQHEVVVDATGAVVSSGLDDGPDDDGGREDDGRDDDGRDDDGRDDDGTEGDPALAADAAVARADAEATALAEAPGTVDRTEIEREDGTVVWDVDIDGDDGLRHDVQVDATTGEIVEHDIDD